MVREFGFAKVAIDEPLERDRELPDDMLRAAEVFEIALGSWLSLPADGWGVDLPPQALYTVGIGSAAQLSLLRITRDFDATYWTTRDAADRALAELLAATPDGPGA